MNREDIIRIAHESHLDVYGLGTDYAKFADALERFAALVATNDTSQERVDKTSEIVHEAQRTWVGLTDVEIDQGLVRTNYAMQTAGAWRDGVEWAVKQLQERNT